MKRTIEMAVTKIEKTGDLVEVHATVQTDDRRWSHQWLVVLVPMTDVPCIGDRLYVSAVPAP